ncbi:MAG: hypothetical protein JRI55_09580, partial [Deltaproteobacteria bacterium]|nr:hypothetical protein [Deltaproteobacteria bacterium]
MRRLLGAGSPIGLSLLVLCAAVGCDDGEQVLPGGNGGGVVDGGTGGGNDGGAGGSRPGTVSSHPRIWADADFAYRDVNDSFEGFWVWQ